MDVTNSTRITPTASSTKQEQAEVTAKETKQDEVKTATLQDDIVTLSSGGGGGHPTRPVKD